MTNSLETRISNSVTDGEHCSGKERWAPRYSTIELREPAKPPAELRAERLMLLGQMVTGVTHDLGNLLTIVSSGLRFIEANPGEEPELRICLQGMRDGVNRAVGLVSQLLAFARQEKLETRAYDLNEILRKMATLLRYAAGPEVRINFDLAADSPTCTLDVLQFNAAILNLVLNARDAMPNGGDIAICTDRLSVGPKAAEHLTPGIYARLRIVDHGDGMSQDVIPSIFDPFFTTKADRGTGLGLPQVSEFMRLIGGHIGVNSGPGAGTTFELLFPASADDTNTERRPG